MRCCARRDRAPGGNYGLPNHLRISTGTAEQNERLLAAMAAAIAAARVSSRRCELRHRVPAAGSAGEMRVPGDKSISHRAAMLGAIAEGTTEIHGFLEGEDCARDARGAAGDGRHGTSGAGPGVVRIRGRRASRGLQGAGLGAGPREFRYLHAAADGLLAGQGFDTILIGDASLMSRPMERVAAPLRRMGADIAHQRRAAAGRHPRRPRARKARAPTRSAERAGQVGAVARGPAGRAAGPACRSRGVSRDHTERMLGAFGVPVGACRAVAIEGPATLACDAHRRSRRFLLGRVLHRAPALIAGPASRSKSATSASTRRARPCSTSCASWVPTSACTPRGTWRGEPRADIEVRPGIVARALWCREPLVPMAMDELPRPVRGGCNRGRGDGRDRGVANCGSRRATAWPPWRRDSRRSASTVETLADGLRIQGGSVDGRRGRKPG